MKNNVFGLYNTGPNTERLTDKIVKFIKYSAEDKVCHKRFGNTGLCMPKRTLTGRRR